MNLKVRINGVEYSDNIVQGSSFTENYEETLNSGTLMLDHMQKINVKPYYDVIIYSEDLADGEHVDSNGDWIGYPNHSSEIKSINLDLEFLNTPLVGETGYDIYLTLSKNIIFYLLRYGIDENESFLINFTDGTDILPVYFSFFKEIDETLPTGKYKLHFKSTTMSQLFLPEYDFVFSYDEIPLVPNEIYPSTTSVVTRNIYYIDSLGDDVKTANAILFKGAEWEIDSETGKYIEPDLFPMTETTFYRHLLVDQFNSDIINLDQDIRKYKFQLFSEAKGLETIQCPNESTTQPLNIEKKISVYDYIVQFVDMYSPKIKVRSNQSIYNNEWVYVPKYSVFPGLQEIFGDVYAPDFSLNLPNLKTTLVQLMLVKDCVPFVKDNVIYAFDITKRHGMFDATNLGLNYVTEAMSSNNYCDILRRQYSNALSQDNSAKIVEYLGFRNSNEAILTLDNMQLEFRYPIYKINKVYLCYYKKIFYAQTRLGTKKPFVFLCKQDISQLVKLETERNLLSKDWSVFNDENLAPKTIEELARYQLSTIGYSSGSNVITGWNARYTSPKVSAFNLYDITRSYLQNIFVFMDARYPYGISSEQYIINLIRNEDTSLTELTSDPIIFCKAPTFNTPYVSLYCPDIQNPPESGSSVLPVDQDNSVLKSKAIFFEVEYDAYYNGMVYASKDNGKDNIVMNDNSSSSLALLEKDGLNQKEKVNRFGNTNYTMNARYTTINDIQNLGSVRQIGSDNDIVIYKREYSIYDNYVLCNYAGSQDYVLKNYYTSVFAKHRTHQLMSYGESVTRAENRKTMIMLSKDKEFYEYPDNSELTFSNFENVNGFIGTIISAFSSSPKYEEKDNRVLIDDINYGYITCQVGEKTYKFASDINVFNCGYSLCFNIAMSDNISGGVFVKSLQKTYSPLVISNLVSRLSGDPDAYENDYVGADQDWYRMINDTETGFIDKLGFYVGHVSKNSNYVGFIPDDNKETIGTIYSQLLALPKIDDEINYFGKITNVIGNEYVINKDNKEKIDMTFQIEPITNDENIVFSEWFMKLSDLSSTYNKVDPFYQIQFSTTNVYSFNVIWGYEEYVLFSSTPPVIKLNIKESDLISPNIFVEGNAININFEYGTNPFVYTQLVTRMYIVSWEFMAKTLGEIAQDYSSIHIIGDERAQRNPYQPVFYNFENSDLLFRKTNTFIGTDNETYFTYELDVTSTSANAVGHWALITDSPNISSFASIYYEVDTNNATVSYWRNMYVVCSPDKLKKTIVYDQYSSTNGLPNVVPSLHVSSIFSVRSNENGEKYIYVDLSGIENLSSINSIQYWYFDDGQAYVRQKLTGDAAIYNTISNDETSVGVGTFDSYTYQYSPQSSAYRFVFGVNLTEEDKENGYAKIYLSMITSRDKRVYDENNNEIGEIHNFAAEDNHDYFGSVQIFDKNE